MTMHLFGTVVTGQAVASNNRGESEGTVSTLQKIIRDGELYSTISSEAIRYALREGWLSDEKVSLNRRVSHDASTWEDKEFKEPSKYIDCDVLGFMHAKKETVSRRGILEIGRAVSTTPWPGTVSAHFASPGSNPSVSTEDPIPYQAEVHDTRYQYTFAMTPDALLDDKFTRTQKTLEGIQNLHRVAGNHSRFLFDFAPELLILRWSSDPAPRIMFCVEQDEAGRLSLAKLTNRLKGGDILASELVIGTAIDVNGMQDLNDAGVRVFSGVKAAVVEVLGRIKKASK